jgi:hypothetical protein
MRNFTSLLLFAILLCSCSKNGDNSPRGISNAPRQPITQRVTPVTNVSITINDAAMNITSLSFERHGDGDGGGMTIIANDNFQKVIAEIYNFYQTKPYGMIYTEEVDYLARDDSSSSWGGDYTRPVPRDDQVTFNNFTPLSDSVVTGNFSASFYSTGGEEKKTINVRGSFQLVFDH